MTGIPSPKWVQARRGFGSVSDRLRSGPCRIAYAGNSVTAQRDGYVRPLHDNLIARSGNSHAVIQAGLSGMGSMGCLFTLDRFVLSHAPDLCFVECTVGDSGISPPLASIEPVLEGIVRKLSAVGSACCILHGYRSDRTLDDLQPVLDRYERVANHYGIPSIQLGQAIREGEASGAWSIQELFLDGLHTRSKGAQIIANLVGEALQHILAAEASSDTVLNPRLHADDLESAHLLFPNAAMTLLPDAFRTGRFRLTLPLVELDSGNGLRIETAPGNIWGLLIVAGPKTGNVLLETDGVTQEYRTWDKWCDRELLRTVIFAAPVRRGSAFRLLVTDRGGPDLDGFVSNTPKILKVAGLMLSGEGEPGVQIHHSGGRL